MEHGISGFCTMLFLKMSFSIDYSFNSQLGFMLNVPLSSHGVVRSIGVV